MEETNRIYTNKFQEFVSTNAIKMKSEEKNELKKTFISLNPTYGLFLKEYESLSQAHNDTQIKINALETKGSSPNETKRKNLIQNYFSGK